MVIEHIRVIMPKYKDDLLSESEQKKYNATVKFLSNNRMVAENVLSFYMTSVSHIIILKHNLTQAIIRPYVQGMDEGVIKAGLSQMINGLARKAVFARDYLESPSVRGLNKAHALDALLKIPSEDATKTNLKNIIKLKNKVILAYALCALLTVIAVGVVVAGALGLAGLPVAAGLIAAGTFAASQAVLVTGAVAAHKAAAIATASVSGAAYLASKLGVFKNIKNRIQLSDDLDKKPLSL